MSGETHDQSRESAAANTQPATAGSWRGPLLAAVLSAGVGLLFAAHARDLAGLRQLGLDALFYHEWAQDIVAGRGYDGAYFQGPLYPHFLALVYRLGGGPQTATALLVQTILTALCTAMVFTLARRLAGSRAGWAAAVLHAGYGFGLVLSRTLVPAVLLETLLLASLLAGLAGAASTSRGRSWTWWGAAGLLLGLAALGRASVLIIPLPLLGIRLARGGWRQPRMLVAVGIAALAAVLAILPVSLRNARLDRGFVPVSANGGYNYHVGNHDEATGAFVAQSGVAFFQPGTAHDGGTVALARERAGAEGAAFSAGQASRWWWRQGLAWNREHPGRTAALWLRKLVMLLSDYEVPQIENFDELRDESFWLRWNPFRFAVLMGLGVVGAVLTGRRHREAATLAWLGAGVLLSVLPFFVVARFRLPLVPLLAVFGGGAAVAIAGWVASRQRARALTAVAGAVAVTALALVHVPAGVRAGGEMLREYNRGVLAIQDNDLNAAIGWFTASARLHDNHGPTWSNLGASLLAVGRPSDAATALARALALEPENPEILTLFVRAALESGRGDDAVAALEGHVADHPGAALAWLFLGDLRQDGGDRAGAIYAWRQAEITAQDPEVARVARQKLTSVRDDTIGP